MRYIGNKEQNGRPKPNHSNGNVVLSGLNISTKKQRSSDWIKKKTAYNYMPSVIDSILVQRQKWALRKGMEKMYCTNIKRKRVGIDTLILGGGKYDFKKKILAERGKFHNDKRLNSSKRYSNYKCICT